MQKIKSFQVDHRRLKEGIYISRVDGDIVTYDLRFCRPNCGILLDNPTIHTVEHMLATFARNSEYKDDIIYFGPMGCQTGFYLVTRGSMTSKQTLALVRDMLQKTIAHEGEVFGASEIECGNYKNLNLLLAKKASRVYLEKIRDLDDVMEYETVSE